MTLPAAAPLALWGTGFLRGLVPPDLLIEHCGPEALPLLVGLRGRVSQIELVVPIPGDLAGLTTSSLDPVWTAGSVAFFRPVELISLPPHWNTFPAARSQYPPTRSDAERELAEAFTTAIDFFSTENPTFNLTRPSLPSFDEFPDFWPAPLRQLLNRATQTLSICEPIRTAWQHTSNDEVQLVINNLASAARRAFEAAVVLP